MRKVIILMGEANYEGSYIIGVFDFNERDEILKNVEEYDCAKCGTSEWEKVLKDDFKEKYCNGFDSYYLDIREIIKLNQ